MNRLKPETQARVIRSLTEGCSVRSTERMTGVHRGSILRLMVRVGEACGRFMDREMRDLPCARLELDEQWTFVAKKQRHLKSEDDERCMGDFFVWNAFDPDSKALPAFHVGLGKRGRADAHAFLGDLAPRLRNRVQISTDALTAYVEAIDMHFGRDVDYAQIVKSFEVEPIGPGRYAPPRVTRIERTPICGKPKEEAISTSGVERLHLLNRMRVRRMTRLVDGFSKKLENLKAALQVHYATYNYVKPHKSLGGITPAMALGVTDRLWEIEELVGLAAW
jgi:IS1 family transposase